MRRLCPHLFGAVDITQAPQQVFAELRAAHERVLERHRRVAAVYAQWDQKGVYWDHDTAGDYARAQAAGVTCVPLLVETFGGLSPTLMRELRAAAEWRSNKLTSSEYDETTWSARTWLTFVAQRLSVAVQLSVAQEAAEALGLSVAADPRAR